MTRSERRIAGLCLPLTACVCASIVLSVDARAAEAGSAEAPPEATSVADKARNLFREGRTLAASGKYDEACPKFEDSMELDAGIGTEFNLADCWEHTGHLKKAQAMFVRVADAAHEKGQADREQVARERAQSLDEKLPKIGVEAKDIVDGLDVSIDGQTIDRTHWAAGERVDPGPHEIRASAPHKAPWSLRVDVSAAGSTLVVTVPKLEDDRSTTPAANAQEKDREEPKPAPLQEQPAEESRPAGPNPIAKILLLSGAGAGVLLAATGFAVYRLSNDNAKGVCPSSVGCTPDDVQRHSGFVDDAALGRGIGYLGLGITGAALIGLSVVTITSSSTGREARPSASLAASPFLGSGAWGASVKGRF